MSNRLFGLYGRMWRHAGSEEARQIVLSSGPSSASSSSSSPSAGRSAVRAGPADRRRRRLHLRRGRAMGVLRFHSRLFAWQRGSRAVGLRVAVIGSRDAGAAAIREMLRNPEAGLFPVAVFDDDPRAHGLSLLGVPVVGRIADIPDAAPRYTIQQVLLAIPSPSPELVERALRPPRRAGVTMKILPGVRDMARRAGARRPAMRQVRYPRIEDLLGRTQVPTDLEAVRRSLAGRRVLVTGAGGSIGIGDLPPGGRASTRPCSSCSTTTRPTSTTPPPPWSVPASRPWSTSTDRTAVLEVFDRYRPEVVFHAAAHKHVPVLEDHPRRPPPHQRLRHPERGRRRRRGRAPSASSDLHRQGRPPLAASWAPPSGWPSRSCSSRAPEGAAYCTVRFGNVLGSRGSVIPTFARQIARAARSPSPTPA